MVSVFSLLFRIGDQPAFQPASSRDQPASEFDHQHFLKEIFLHELISNSSDWIPELRHYAPGVPIILVGTKLDLRDDKQFFIDHSGAVPITTAQGEELRKVIGAPAYIECSSKTQQVLTIPSVKDLKLDFMPASFMPSQLLWFLMYSIPSRKKLQAFGV